jgi:uncharacterized protein YeaO (DUF488 family)
MSRRVSPQRIGLKRAYEAASPDDGQRILVDRLWPRGVKKSDAAIDEWMKELAPSAELRKWFAHDPARWEEFRLRFRSELHQRSDELSKLRALARDSRVKLVYAARDEVHNDAVVLRDILLGR